MRNNRTIVLILIAFLISLNVSCSRPETTAAPPFVPAEYYDCLEVRPDELVDIYFSNYGNLKTAEAMYNGKMFVLKNIPIEDWMLIHLDEGWIWVDQISCYLDEKCDTSYLEVGTRIDVVGINAGLNEPDRPGLMFTDCIVIPAGAVSLPADPGAGPIVPGY